MTTLVIGSGLVGSQVAQILTERGEKPVLMDHAAQPGAPLWARLRSAATAKRVVAALVAP